MSEPITGRFQPMLSDADVRPLLRAWLLSEAATEPDTVVIEELGICRGQVRIDLAVVNGTIHGYEIKSDRDSLRRLDVQIDYYSRVLDRATIVTGERHLRQVQNVVPSWWGVLLVRLTNIGPQFKTVRRGRNNPSRDPRSLVEFLWLKDAMMLIEQHGVAKGVRGKPRRYVWDRVCASVTVSEMAAVVRQRLKARANPASP